MTYFKYRVGTALGHLLYVHAPLRAANEHGAAVRPVYQDGKVRLPLNVQGLSHHHLQWNTQQT